MSATSMPGICWPAHDCAEGGAVVAMPGLETLLADGGPVVAYTPGLAPEFAFILEIEGIAPVVAV